MTRLLFGSAVRLSTRGASASVIPLMLCAPLVLGACSVNDDAVAALETAGPGWAAEFDKVRERAKGTAAEALTLRVLDDGQISDGELSEVSARFVECVQVGGFPEWTMDPFSDINGTALRLSDADQERLMNLQTDCMWSTGFADVQALWSSMRQNPSNANMSEIYAACMVKLGAVDPSLTGQDFEKFFAEFGQKQEELGNPKDFEPSDVMPLLVDKQAGREAFWRCTREPQNVLGFSTATP